MTQPAARIVLDSLAPSGVRLTTMEVTCHRYVLAEFNTHRDFSRNSASSRAIPIEKQLERVREDPAWPSEWGANQSGMQATAQLSENEQKLARRYWAAARDNAVRSVEVLQRIGLHKQVANRLLEPFMWHTIIVSSTRWENFFAQRCSPLAQPEIRLAAEAMRVALNASTPTPMAFGEWHTPYIQADEYETCSPKQRIKLSVARCARVSYLTHEGTRDHSADYALYARLIAAQPPHASPLEHVATPLPFFSTVPSNFHGWWQWRHAMTVGEQS